MATFTAIKNRGGGRGALGGVLRYVQQEEKTLWEGQQLVSGWNCTAQSALSEMKLTKERYRKTDGRQYYHFVQSFGEQDGLTPQELHAMGLELAQREFPDFEVLVATHVDTAHPHNHLVVNSVSFQDGRKLHQSAADLQAHRLASDEICIAHGLEILPPPQRRAKADGHPGVPLRRQGPELEVPAHERHRPVYAVRRLQGRVHFPDGERGIPSAVDRWVEEHHLHHAPGYEVPGRPAPRGEVHQGGHGT